jgi:hypothetical protein
MAWYALRLGHEAPTEAELFRMEQGQEIGILARQLYPGGIVLNGDGRDPAEIARGLERNVSINTLFEVTAQAGVFVAKADILARDGSGWQILEVKSNFSDTKNMKDLVDDLAYTVMVFRRAGVRVVKASLVLLSRNYRFSDGTDRLFQIVEKTSEVNDRAVEFESEADSVARVLFDKTQPVPALVSACRDCVVYEDKCLGSGVTHTVLEIPRLHHTKLKRLSQDGIIDALQIPDGLNLNECQQRAKKAMVSGKIVVEPGLRAALQDVQWPCHYLDFETVATFLPLYPTHGCHRQTVTQFSIHRRESIDAEPSHCEYLADPKKNCERELAEALIEKLDRAGSILAYTNFEEKRIEALRDEFPDLADSLQAILSRLKDLEKVIESNIYHPEFGGSFSIKAVLPALVPELSYAELEVRDGETAVARFARMAKGEVSGDKAQAIRRQLLEYCKMDSYGMLKLHEVLVRLAAK